MRKLVNYWNDVVPKGPYSPFSVQETSHFLVIERETYQTEHYSLRHVPVVERCCIGAHTVDGTDAGPLRICITVFDNDYLARVQWACSHQELYIWYRDGYPRL